ncbi:MAG: hypothetical protein A2138_11650 [Deltaproteobacteria bacterium RBG_16_71_12]|nr:MAG: hypothetical protein A2138_11650 [Deltaproteobacteria bacterium RBG_16_71_12]
MSLARVVVTTAFGRGNGAAFLRARTVALGGALGVTLVGALAASTACQHYQTDLPGTLDLRSDGAEAPLEPRPLPPEAARDGLEAWMKGAGASGATTVIAEDRAFWALRLFPLGDGAKDEIDAALGKGGALRSLTLREEISAFDAALFGCTLPIPCVDVGTVTMLPSFTVQLTGTRVRPTGLPTTRELGTEPPVGGGPAAAPTPPLDRPARDQGSSP